MPHCEERAQDFLRSLSEQNTTSRVLAQNQFRNMSLWGFDDIAAHTELILLSLHNSLSPFVYKKGNGVVLGMAFRLMFW